MNICKLILLATINCLIASTAFGAQAPQEEALEAAMPWMQTAHGVDRETLEALKETGKSLEKTAETLRKATENIKVKANIQISPENGIRLTGMALTIMAAASILHSGEVNPTNGTILSTGMVALFGARNIGNCIDYDRED